MYSATCIPEFSVVNQLNLRQTGRQRRYLPMIYAFRITLWCNSRQFWIAKRFKRDMLLEVLGKAKQKFA